MKNIKKFLLGQLSIGNAFLLYVVGNMLHFILVYISKNYELEFSSGKISDILLFQSGLILPLLLAIGLWRCSKNSQAVVWKYLVRVIALKDFVIIILGEYAMFQEIVRPPGP